MTLAARSKVAARNIVSRVVRVVRNEKRLSIVFSILYNDSVVSLSEGRKVQQCWKAIDH